MHKKTIGLACLLSLLWAVPGQATPRKRLDPGTQTCRVFDYESGWWGEGKKIFNRKCKTCHTRDNEDGATFLHSESKTSKAWNRVFLKKNTKCYKDGSWGDISLEEQLLMNDYLYRYGDGSYNPNDEAD